MGDLDLHHMGNCFECLRSRQEPHAPVSDGYAHSVACIMAACSIHTALACNPALPSPS